MKLRLLLTAVTVGAAAFVLSGCGTEAHRIDTSSNQGLTTVDDINFKDWQIAGEKCVKTMLDSGVLKRKDDRKTVIMISTVKNSTNEHVNTRLLTDRIRLAILRSGQAVTTTAVSGSGPEDNASRQVRELSNDKMFNKSTVVKQGTAIAPDVSLAGEIVQQKTKSGRSYESYFFIHMTLTDLKTGLAVWEDNVEIAKQAKKPWFGW
ncbi:MAG: penicillin-binding protein activator LpoB [Lentisphaerae bacterium]|nr:penicillin-binding protein activator LpoB [Lentisphaerota bacterium]MCP4102050.1 penicillin-binding protein activator LpoB [Lentisphaerota bacterium]